MKKTLDYYLTLDYPVETRRIDTSLGGGYVASIPTLGSQAFVGDGETPQEAYENLQAAKKEIFAEYLQEGVAIPEPVDQMEYEDYSGKLVLRMPRQLHARLAAAAKRNDTSLNQFIVYALGAFEAKWSTLQEVRQALVAFWAGAATWHGGPLATVLQRNEGTEPIITIGGPERSMKWT